MTWNIQYVIRDSIIHISPANYSQIRTMKQSQYVPWPLALKYLRVILHESYIRISQLSSEIFSVDCYNDGSVQQTRQQITWLKHRLIFVAFNSLKFCNITSKLSKSNFELLPVRYFAQTRSYLSNILVFYLTEDLKCINKEIKDI
jgi:hypothetical protein